MSFEFMVYIPSEAIHKNEMITIFISGFHSLEGIKANQHMEIIYMLLLFLQDEMTEYFTTLLIWKICRFEIHGR